MHKYISLFFLEHYSLSSVFLLRTYSKLPLYMYACVCMYVCTYVCMYFCDIDIKYKERPVNFIVSDDLMSSSAFSKKTENLLTI